MREKILSILSALLRIHISVWFFFFLQARSSDEDTTVTYSQGPTFDDDDDDERMLVPDEVLPLDELIKGAATGSVYDPVDLRTGMTLTFYTHCHINHFTLCA
jgi:hypothetical protein